MPPSGERPLTRRELIGTAAAAGTLALGAGTGATPAAAQGTVQAAAAPSPGSAPRVHERGKYATVPLRKESIRVTAIQSRIQSPRDMKNPAREVKANLEHMLELLDAANGSFPGAQDLVCFHEQPIMGWNDWTREQALRVAIEIPGPETEAIGKLAKKHGCYVTFGTYSVDKDWPGHLLLNGVLIGPDGTVVANHWKTNNSRGFKPGWEIYTTSIYDVLDRYREMYGEDAVLPIARTDIGNISCSITPGQTDVMRAHAMKGLELRLSSSSGGYNVEDAAMISLHNRLWTVVCNTAISPDQPGFPEFSGSGDTAIFDPRGRVAARARSFNEEFVTTVIPVGEFRRTRSVPDVPMEMLLPVYSRYSPRNGPNLQAEYQPKDAADAARHVASRRNW